MLLKSTIVQTTRVARTLLVCIAASYGAFAWSTTTVQVQCNNNECRHRIYGEGTQDYCTDPGSHLGTSCWMPGTHCYQDDCVYLGD